jgi:hypothetical protein
LLQVRTVVQTGMVPIDGEGHGPKLVRQGQSGTVMGVRLLVAILPGKPGCLAYPLLKLALSLSQVMEQAGKVPMLRASEEGGETGRVLRHCSQVPREGLANVRVVFHRRN